MVRCVCGSVLKMNEMGGHICPSAPNANCKLPPIFPTYNWDDVDDDSD